MLVKAIIVENFMLKIIQIFYLVLTYLILLDFVKHLFFYSLKNCVKLF
jgi:hypothetical protein